MATKILTHQHGYGYNGQKLIKKELAYEETNHERVFGYGIPISINAARALIKDYWKDLEEISNKPELQKQCSEYLKDRNIAFTLGKEALLTILAQENCMGIRFYLAKKSDEKIPEELINDKWQIGTTLIAVGVGKDNENEANDLGIKGKFLAKIDSAIDNDQITISPPIFEFCGITTLDEVKKS